MILLLVGVLFYSLVHLFPALLPAARQKALRRIGEGPYKGLFSILIFASLALVVLGWKAAVPSAVYRPPLGPGTIPSALMFLALVSFVASVVPSNFRRFIRHPQMTAVCLWSTAHLLTNGDLRAIALFGGLGLWAILEMMLCNRRDGAWVRPAPRARRMDATVIALAAVLFAGVAQFHAALFGVPAAPL